MLLFVLLKPMKQIQNRDKQRMGHTNGWKANMTKTHFPPTTFPIDYFHVYSKNLYLKILSALKNSVSTRMQFVSENPIS